VLRGSVDRRWRHFGVLKGSGIRLIYRLIAPSKSRPLCPRRTPTLSHYQTGFIYRGSTPPVRDSLGHEPAHCRSSWRRSPCRTRQDDGCPAVLTFHSLSVSPCGPSQGDRSLNFYAKAAESVRDTHWQAISNLVDVAIQLGVKMKGARTPATSVSSWRSGWTVVGANGRFLGQLSRFENPVDPDPE
jgi:hypothetical protein